MRVPFWIVSLAAALTLAACGGGGGSSSGGSGSSATTVSGSNAATITVTTSLGGSRIPNLPYVSVTICVPNTTSCQTIDNVLVDTGSVGLRLMASAVSLSLPVKTATAGGTLAECVEFASGYTFGAVRSADITIGGESASAVAVNIIGDSATPNVPTACSNTGTASLNSVSAFGANGVLGVGSQQQDCGTACATSAVARTYYNYASGCTSSTCLATAVPVADQVQNPTILFPTDNNGVVIVMPSISSAGQATATGELRFGIGTQSNNAIGSATVIPIDSSSYFTAVYNSTTMSQSIMDSGSNGFFFSSSIASCSSASGASDFYCPTSSLSLSATITGSSSSTSSASVNSTAVTFPIYNAVTLLSANNGNNYALPGLGGSSVISGFDFGFPFFYGRSVFMAITGKSTSAGTGPYLAF